MRAIIFANGYLSDYAPVIAFLREDDLLIAADGGAMHCLKMGITPQFIIGDFDSLTPEHLAALQSQGSQLLRFPNRKDFTDLELALQHAAQSPVDETIVFGALGLRWDQTLANLLLPAAKMMQGQKVRFLDSNQEIFHIFPSAEPTLITGQEGDTVSLIPIGGDVHGVTTQGLEYPLKRESLSFGAARGVSNVLAHSPAMVSLESGRLVCVMIHQAKSGDL